MTSRRVTTYRTNVAIGEGWSRSFRVFVDDADETPITLVGGTVDFYLARKDGTEVAHLVSGTDDEVEVTDAAGGEFTVALPGATTAEFPASDLNMEIWITLDGNEPARWIKGTMSVDRSLAVES